MSNEFSPIELDIFEENSITNYMNSWLSTIKECKGINNYSVEETKQLTWENNYSNPLEKLLAIEAVEKYGAIIEVDSPNEHPEYIKGYPYAFKTRYRIEFNASNRKERYYEWYYDEYELPDLEKSTDYKLEEFYSWEIDDPTGEILVSILINPVKPIKFYTLSATMKDNGTFIDWLEETYTKIKPKNFNLI